MAGYGAHFRIEDGRVETDDCSLVFGGQPDVLVVAAGDDVCLLDCDSAGLVISAASALDLTRALSTVRAGGVAVEEHRILRGARRNLEVLVRLLAAADAVGGAVGCVESAAGYAKERHAFGRPIGQFQAVKHHCATMLTLTELATAAVWQATATVAAGSLEEAEDAVDVAITVALPAYVKCASLNIQVHGGIGFTWEQDAHLYLRRAVALRALADPQGLASGRVADRLRRSTVRPISAGATNASPSLPGDVSGLVETVLAAEPPQRLAALVATGLLYPELPPPWGIGAGAELQLAVDTVLRGINRGALLDRMTFWMVPIVVPTLIRHGTTDQQDRWNPPRTDGPSPVVPALQRARSRERPRRPDHQSCSVGWRLARLRPEGLDQLRHASRPRAGPGPYRPRRTEARGDHLHGDRSGGARRHRAAPA